MRRFFIAALVLSVWPTVPLYAPPAQSAGQRCKTALINFSPEAVISPTYYVQRDAGDHDFHISATLSATGVLRIGTHLADSEGHRSSLDTGKTVKAILAHFGEKISRVEVTLSQFETLDEHLTTADPMLDAFNAAWNRGSQDPKVILERQIAGDYFDIDQHLTSLGILSTPFGTGIAFSRYGLRRISLGKTLGEKGKFISVEVIFEKQ